MTILLRRLPLTSNDHAFHNYHFCGPCVSVWDLFYLRPRKLRYDHQIYFHHYSCSWSMVIRKWQYCDFFALYAINYNTLPVITLKVGKSKVPLVFAWRPRSLGYGHHIYFYMSSFCWCAVNHKKWPYLQHYGQISRNFGVHVH